MRRFVFVNANDYIGCCDPVGRFIQTDIEGDEGTLDVLESCLDLWGGEKEHVKEYWFAFEMEEATTKAKLDHIIGMPNGDGGPCNYVFEIVNDEMVLIYPIGD